MFWESPIVDDFTAQPAEVSSATPTFDLIAAAIFRDGDATVWAGLGAKNLVGVFNVGAVVFQVTLVVLDA